MKKILIIVASLALFGGLVTGGVVLARSYLHHREQAAVNKAIDNYYSSKPTQSDPQALDNFNKNSKALTTPPATSPCHNVSEYEIKTNDSVSCVHGGD